MDKWDYYRFSHNKIDPNAFFLNNTNNRISFFYAIAGNLHCIPLSIFTRIMKVADTFRGVISNLDFLPPQLTIAVIQRLYHTLLTRMTQNPGGAPLIHVAASYAVRYKLGKKKKKLLLNHFLWIIIYHRLVKVEQPLRSQWKKYIAVSGNCYNNLWTF